MTRAMVGLLASVFVGGLAAGCATGPVYTKKTDREGAAIDALECNKVALVTYRATRKKYANPDGPEARQKATVAAHAAGRRCLVAHGWKKRPD